MSPSGEIVQLAGEAGLHLALRVDAGEALEEIGVGHLADGRGGAGGRVEIGRLELHAEGERVLGLGRGLREGGEHHGGGRNREKSAHLSTLK